MNNLTELRKMAVAEETKELIDRIEENKCECEGGGSGSSGSGSGSSEGPLVVNMEMSDDYVTLDKNYNEILEAVEDGRYVMFMAQDALVSNTYLYFGYLSAIEHNPAIGNAPEQYIVGVANWIDGNFTANQYISSTATGTLTLIFDENPTV